MLKQGKMRNNDGRPFFAFWIPVEKAMFRKRSCLAMSRCARQCVLLITIKILKELVCKHHLGVIGLSTWWLARILICLTCCMLIHWSTVYFILEWYWFCLLKRWWFGSGMTGMIYRVFFRREEGKRLPKSPRFKVRGFAAAGLVIGRQPGRELWEHVKHLRWRLGAHRPEDYKAYRCI